MNEQTEKKFIDYSQYRDNSHEVRWTDLTKSSQLGSQLIDLISCVAKLPEPDLQLPILASVALTPSTLSTISPVNFLYGATGTGKSAVGVVISKLFKNVTPLMGTATTASIRNELNSRKWLDFPDCEYETNCVLIWDDIHPSLFTLELFTILKCGYSRETSITTIAGANGVNIRFDTYGPKWISSISPLWAITDYQELKRRSLIFHTKSLTDFAVLPDDLTLFDYESIDFTGLSKKFNDFWNSEANLIEYSKIKRSLSKLRGKVKNLQLFKITLDALTAGYLTGVFKSEDHAIKSLIDYSHYLNDFINLKPPSLLLLSAFLKDIESKFTKENQELIELDLPTKQPTVKPRIIKDFLKQEADNGNLEQNLINNSFIHDLMNSLGWKLIKIGKDSLWSKTK